MFNSATDGLGFVPRLWTETAAAHLANLSWQSQRTNCALRLMLSKFYSNLLADTLFLIMQKYIIIKHQKKLEDDLYCSLLSSLMIRVCSVSREI